MPTESFSLAVASPSYTGTIVNERTTPERGGSTLGAWRDAMHAGGWTDYDDVYASITVRLDVAQLPVMTVPPLDDKLDGTVICTLRAAIIITATGFFEPFQIWGYDPGAYTPPPCDAFSYGLTQQDTADTFKVKLADVLSMIIVDTKIDGTVETLTYQSVAPGPGPNGTGVAGWVNGTIWYGGYNLRSETYRGNFLDVTGLEGPGSLGKNHHAWEFLAKVHRGGAPAGGAEQRFDLWLDPAQSSQLVWRIVVCPYQFAIWMDGQADDTATGTPYPRAAFISMPWVPDDFRGHIVFAFVATSILGVFRNTLKWNGYTWFDGGPWSTSESSGVIVPALRTRTTVQTPGTPDRLTTTQGMLITDNAWITAARDPASVFVIDHRLAGKLWNCCTVNDNYPSSTTFGTMMDTPWVHVSSESYYPNYAAPGVPFLDGMQKASVWWRVESGDIPLPE